MPLALDENRATYQVQGYKPGAIQINETTYSGSVVVSAETLITDWPPQRLVELTRSHLEAIIALKPAILLLGTGAELEFPALEIYGDLINLGIGVEVMSTSAACKTYNALTSENRNVVAALIIS